MWGMVKKHEKIKKIYHLVVLFLTYIVGGKWGRNRENYKKREKGTT